MAKKEFTCAFCGHKGTTKVMEQTHGKDWVCKDEQACDARQQANKPATKTTPPEPKRTPTCTTCGREIQGTPEYIGGKAFCPLTPDGKVQEECVKPSISAQASALAASIGKKKAEKSTKTTSTPKTPANDRIVLLVTENPKKGASAERFAKYTDGMTMAETHTQGITSGDLLWDKHPMRKFIAIVPAAEYDSWTPEKRAEYRADVQAKSAPRPKPTSKPELTLAELAGKVSALSDEDYAALMEMVLNSRTASAE